MPVSLPFLLYSAISIFFIQFTDIIIHFIFKFKFMFFIDCKILSIEEIAKNRLR